MRGATHGRREVGGARGGEPPRETKVADLDGQAHVEEDILRRQLPSSDRCSSVEHAEGDHW